MTTQQDALRKLAQELVTLSPAGSLAQQKAQALVEALAAQPEQPVAVVRQNASGGIRIETPEGDAFDVSKHVGASFYASSQQPAKLSGVPKGDALANMAPLTVSIAKGDPDRVCMTYEELREFASNLLAASPQVRAEPAPEAVRELISGIRSINRSKQHLIKIGDDECYWQRGEWVTWLLQLADEAERAIGQVRAEQAAVPPEGPFGMALNVRHKDCHKAADAFWKYWDENGETHKRGYYESTWGAINQALKLVGVMPWTYGDTIPAYPLPQPPQENQS